MNAQERNATRERIATACLAAMLGHMDQWGAGIDGQEKAKIACDYADALLAELARREEQRAA